MEQNDWWKSFFSGLMVEFWVAAIPSESTSADADFFFRTLDLSPGDRVLDVPCGHGRFTLQLAARGCRVTGLDLSPEFLAAARAETGPREGAVEWRQGDMRELPWRSEFDAVLCAGNSFGYFDDGGNRAFLQAVAGALKPGGRFLLDSGWVAEALFPNFHERLELERGGIRFQAENRHEPLTGRVENLFTVEKGDRREVRAASHRVYTCREIAQLLESCGFGDLRTFGSAAGDPFVLGSPRLIIAARRLS